MGTIAEKGADYLILTDDNPRNEKSEQILKDILRGIKDKSLLQVIASRQEAIQYAFNQAKENDIVLVAGKGHEDYQIIGNKKTYFDDKKVIKNLFKEVK
jgi:UDP-N-acetylmuramoyl-L-alanyl-D-glutamate--2,6-diaminopimelate ligase